MCMLAMNVNGDTLNLDFVDAKIGYGKPYVNVSLRRDDTRFISSFEIYFDIM